MANMMPDYLGVTERGTGNKILINMKNVEFVSNHQMGADIHFVSGMTLEVQENRKQIVNALFCNMPQLEA